VNNFTKRALTGTLLVIVLVLSIYWRAYSYFTLFFLITVLSLREFYALLEQSGRNIQPQKVPGMVMGGLLYILTAFMANSVLPAAYLVVLIPFVVLLFVAELFRKESNPFGNIGYTLLGLFYVALPFSLLHFLAFPFGAGQYDYRLVLSFFVLLWCSDTGAYISGKQLGRRKLFERISPKKTWEGSIGGTLITLGAAYGLHHLFADMGLSVADWLIMALIVVVLGTLGDLVESMLKRSLEVKDSGNILPGHGGLLDRFDGLLLAVPSLIFYLHYLRNI
jgi:phosphatidate cytidylyltransferase